MDDELKGVPEEISDENAVLSDDAFDDADVSEDDEFATETTEKDPDDMGLDVDESYD